MKGPIFGALALAIGLSFFGCGGDDDDSGSGDRCHDGCVAVMAAMCPFSPDSQATCEADCRDEEMGTCATEWKAFQDCAVGKPITCVPPLGIPGAEGCDSQQNAYIACGT